MKNEESRLQRACVEWFRYQYPDRIIFAIPNGGKRNAVTASIMKKEGALAGVADLCLLYPRGEYHACFIEMKYGKGKQSPAQKAFEVYCVKNNYFYRVCCSLEHFMQTVSIYESLL
ncbi:MAG: VRR-NUC domain-containing protein [Bacteroidales bacterium]|jgi:hypothetical protein|nr:VRR-NUC domain-containing protein [Bacteroidales bacterium]